MPRAKVEKCTYESFVDGTSCTPGLLRYSAVNGEVILDDGGRDCPAYMVINLKRRNLKKNVEWVASAENRDPKQKSRIIHGYGPTQREAIADLIMNYPRRFGIMSIKDDPEKHMGFA